MADTFDAMTSDRYYRRSLDFDAALTELGRSKGSQLDPDFVDAFVAMVREPASPLTCVRACKPTSPRFDGRCPGTKVSILQASPFLVYAESSGQPWTG